jgi:UDP-N-acetylmuramoyl-tripeptide--D-alanyl-D-alanine ligase
MEQPLWSATEARDATAGTLKGQETWNATGVSIDSRTIENGDLFVALKGPHRDAHDYVPAAFQNGAAAAVVSSALPKYETSRAYLSVANTFDALNNLAVAGRERCAAQRIAVTGSVGKTGTKEMLKLVFGTQAKAHASAASYNNLWGVPLTLARMPADTKYGIFEIGMNHAGEISPLTRLVSPHVAIITTIEPVHLEFFASVEDIADAKGEIFEGLVSPAVAILNGDSPHLQRLTERARCCGAKALIVFGHSSNADVRLIDMKLSKTGSLVEADVFGEHISYELSVFGSHWVMNSLAVLAAVQAVGANISRAAQALLEMRVPTGRGKTHIIKLADGTVTLIDESYNANPASMRAAIKSLGERPLDSGGRRIVVLGDMLELGDRGPEFHAEVYRHLADSQVDLVFLSGPLMKNLWSRLDTALRGDYGATPEDLAEPVLATIRAGDVVMVKGSLGSQMRIVVDAMITQAGERHSGDIVKAGGYHNAL